MNVLTAGVRDADAEELYRKYWPMVLTRCRSILGDADNAADAAQEVFVKMLEKPHIIKAEYKSSLLWTIATNYCLNIVKSRARHNTLHDSDPILAKIASSLDIEAKFENRDTLRKLFDKHSESTRTIAVLHYVDGMSVKRIARIMNISQHNVHGKLRALRQTLKKMENV